MPVVWTIKDELRLRCWAAEEKCSAFKYPGKLFMDIYGRLPVNCTKSTIWGSKREAKRYQESFRMWMPALQRLFQGQGTPSRSSISPPWACRMGQHEGPASAVRNDCGCAGICTLCVPHRRQCRVSKRYGFWHLGHRSPRFMQVQKGKHSCITQYHAHSCGVAFPVSNHLDLKAKHSKTMQTI